MLLTLVHNLLAYINTHIIMQVCRQAFCDMYNEPILEQLSQYLLDKYVDPDNPSHARLASVIKSVPRQGTLDIEKVKESEYFFS